MFRMENLPLPLRRGPEANPVMDIYFSLKAFPYL